MEKYKERYESAGVIELHIGEKIKKFRDENGISEETFANLIGVHRSTIINYEHGQSKPRFPERINRILNLSGSELEQILPQKKSRKGRAQKAKPGNAAVGQGTFVPPKAPNDSDTLNPRQLENITQLVGLLSDEQKGLLAGYIDALRTDELMTGDVNRRER